ncbi:hypothetical protein OS493_026516 [Desmophyllum pertusum]|uniref:Uncharacterized protein n=1 Tax=Desmophyllum pertusum TaxID=174260 RepID=A0A9W9YKV1_9CNID|nr:hypothetical protein OS493_026516 [Desmophyllum pertusum]
MMVNVFLVGATSVKFPSALINQSDTVDGNESFHLKPYTDTKGISNLFDVDFDDIDARKSRDRENLALRRMLRAGKSRHNLDAVHSTSHGKTNEVGEAKKSLPSSFTNGDKAEVLDRSVGVVPLRSERKVFVREKPLKALAKDSTEQPRQLQRSPSKEKSFREQALAKKSARSVQPSSTKTHLHALTALIRMSAKNAGGEEA